jgi:hypothetical protein
MLQEATEKRGSVCMNFATLTVDIVENAQSKNTTGFVSGCPHPTTHDDKWQI